MKTSLHLAASSVLFATLTISAQAAVPVASYSFNDSLAANEAGAPALTSIDPLGRNQFETAVVNGVSQRVFHWDGNGGVATEQAGLKLDATGLVSFDSYSIQLTFEFLEPAQSGGGWRRIVDAQNRQSDAGFYVEPNNRLMVYPVEIGSTLFTTSVFHDVLLTNAVVNGVSEVKAYLDGNLELSLNTDQFNLDNPSNPGHLLHFFVDNLASDAQLEFADGRIASLSLYEGSITPADIEPAVPPVTAPVPEPDTYAMILLGLGFVGSFARRGQSKR